jgi:hypothetical protein
MPQETTKLTPLEEQMFLRWAQESKLADLDHPESRYDYRGYWKDVAAKGRDQKKNYPDGPHFPDTWKQHGHPTFSVESKYSIGPGDGGRWLGEQFVPQGADFLVNSRGKSKLPIEALVQVLQGR